MNFTTTLDHVAQAAVLQGRTVVKATPGVIHSASLIARDLPNNPWSMAAFAAAASIMVTLVTVYLWPNGETAAPTRDATNAAGVQRLAHQGLDASDIARRTGMSKDAVTTILRAKALGRGEPAVPGRKSQPSAA
jgi:hypothetical protein